MGDRPDPTVTHTAATEPLSDERALQELRTLLLSEEQKQILALRERLDNPQQRSLETSAVVAEAIRLRQQQGGARDLHEALAPSVEDVLRESIRKDPGILAEVLFPVMGPAIRKSVAEAIRGMLEFFNTALERSLSLDGIKWRIEAFRSGRPYAEVALLKSVIYRVEQVFVIHRKAGLLLLHEVRSDVAANDGDLVAGMLSAIQDLVRDSFEAAQGEALDSFQVGDLHLWVEHSPYAALAVVIRGEAPQSYRLLMQEKIEDFHRRFGSELERFDGDARLLESYHPELADLLVASYIEKPRKSRPYFVVLLLLLIGVLAGWQVWGFIQMRKWRAFVDALRQQPGIVVTDFEKRNGTFRIRRLRDPLALDPRALAETAGLDVQSADFQWQAFCSLDDALVMRRAQQFLRPPTTTVLGMDRGTLRVAGKSTRMWAEQLHALAPLIPGVRTIDDHNLNNPNAFRRQKAALESAIILFSLGSVELNANQRSRLAELSEPLQSLIQSAETYNRELKIDVVGHSDNTGPERINAPLSQRRARQVVAELKRAGIDGRYLRARGAGATEPVRHGIVPSDLRYNRSVTFQANLSARPK